MQGYIADSYAQLVQFRLFVLYTAWSIDKHNDYRKVRKDIATAKVVMPTVLHDIAWRAMQVHGALGTTNDMPFFRMILGAGVMGLADGPTEVHKVTVARQVLRDYRPERRPVADPVPAHVARRGPGQVRRLPRARSGEPVTDIDQALHGSDDTPTLTRVDELAAWMDAEGLGVGAPIEHRYISGGSQNEIYEVRRGDVHGAIRIPPATAVADRDKGIVREWRIIEALDGTDVPHTQAIALCTDTSVLGRTFYVMGFVDGWSPMGTHGVWPEPFNSDLEARRGLAFQLVEGIARLSKVDWQAKGLADLGHPDGFHERQVGALDGLPGSHQDPRAARVRRGLGLAAGPTHRSTSSPG